MQALPILTMIVFLPLLGAVPCLVLHRYAEACRWLSLVVTLVVLGFILAVPFFDLAPQPGTGWLLVEDYAWIERLGIRYTLALDGISLLLILLTAFLTCVCVLVSWRQIKAGAGGFHFFLLVMETGTLGVFLATDLFLFYLFWEVQLIPMFFLIGLWGHAGRVRAAVKFLLYSLSGSLLMLLAIIGLYAIHGAQTGVYTSSLAALRETVLTSWTGMWLYAAFLLAFAVKMPIFPVHAWLPDAHTEAPTAGSVILAGILLKTGAYALLRFAFPLFPAAALGSASLLLPAGLIGLYYAAWIAFAQTDMKRLVAYSSIGHMGFIVIGTAIWNELSLSGTVLQMVNHGLSTSALFILVGMLDERLHTRRLADAGGLWKSMPLLGGCFLFFGLASAGLPGLNNFVSELLILVGAFTKRPLVGALGFGAMVLTLVYVLRIVQDIFFGPSRGTQNPGDLTARELLILAPLAAAVLFLGLHPQPLLDMLQEPVRILLEQASPLQTAGR
ncbi:MAG: NADH-quinone oxidoreductase subunit M [Desulfohalobiaceae bacterium]|nr:NADH-quinone oxidoreductase subunit M [Desulfohalobiaceae bacterium]